MTPLFPLGLDYNPLTGKDLELMGSVTRVLVLYAPSTSLRVQLGSLCLSSPQTGKR